MVSTDPMVLDAADEWEWMGELVDAEDMQEGKWYEEEWTTEPGEGLTTTSAVNVTRPQTTPFTQTPPPLHTQKPYNASSYEPLWNLVDS
jgi:hypothetical protein